MVKTVDQIPRTKFEDSDSVVFNRKMALLFTSNKQKQKNELKMKENNLFNTAFNNNNASILINAVNSKPTTRLHFWLGRYYENHDCKIESLHQYQIARAYNESVRLFCAQKQFGIAEAIATFSKNPKTICFFAKSILQLSPEKAYQYFSSIHYIEPLISYSIKEKKLFSKVHASECPLFFCQSTQFHKLLEDNNEFLLSGRLWKKAQKYDKAIKICFEHHYHDQLLKIAKILPLNQTHLLNDIISYFEKNNDWKRLSILYFGRENYQNCLDIIIQHPEISFSLTSFHKTLKVSKNPLIAQICEMQKDYLLAAKIRFNCFDISQAFCDILLSKNENLIINFAEQIKTNDAYSKAGDFLLTLNPPIHSRLFKIASDFYEKANDYHGLMCIQYNIAKFAASSSIRNYVKAEKFLKEGIKYYELSNESDPSMKKMHYELWLMKILIRLETYITETDKDKESYLMYTITDLISINDRTEFVTKADLHALLAEHYLLLNNFESAHEQMKKIQDLNINPSLYFDEDSIKRVYRLANDSFNPTQYEIDNPALFKVPAKFPPDVNLPTYVMDFDPFLI